MLAFSVALMLALSVPKLAEIVLNCCLSSLLSILHLCFFLTLFLKGAVQRTIRTTNRTG